MADACCDGQCLGRHLCIACGVLQPLQDPIAHLDLAFPPLVQISSISVLFGFSIAVINTMTKSNLGMDEMVYKP